MEKEFSFALIGDDEEIMFIRLKSGFRTSTHQDLLYSCVQENLDRGIKNWIIDLEEVPFPTITVMALFIAITVQIRNLGGELTLVSLQQSAKNNFSTFSPLTFLTIEPSVESVVEVIEKAKEKQKSPQVVEKPQEEIAEHPIVDTFDHSNFIDDETSTIIIDDELKFESEKERGSTKKVKNEKEKPLVNELIQVDSQSLELYKICDFIVEHARTAGIKEKQVGKIKISVYEACLNVIEHAYHSKPGNIIEVAVEYNHAYFKIIIRDFGLAFRKLQNKTYDVEQAVENRQSGGFGLHIINRSMDEVTYESDALNGNCLILVKFLPA
ncbi:MAG: hypothetical protein DWQ05_08285 [Calditrichaeota bacterium]|nr:MAG: hypothetical protein DWQ05_08285 [Calditrichota bacterium]